MVARVIDPVRRGRGVGMITGYQSAWRSRAIGNSHGRLRRGLRPPRHPGLLSSRSSRRAAWIKKAVASWHNSRNWLRATVIAFASTRAPDPILGSRATAKRDDGAGETSGEQEEPILRSSLIRNCENKEQPACRGRQRECSSHSVPRTNRRMVVAADHQCCSDESRQDRRRKSLSRTSAESDRPHHEQRADKAKASNRWANWKVEGPSSAEVSFMGLQALPALGLADHGLGWRRLARGERRHGDQPTAHRRLYQPRRGCGRSWLSDGQKLTATSDALGRYELGRLSDRRHEAAKAMKPARRQFANVGLATVARSMAAGLVLTSRKALCVARDARRARGRFYTRRATEASPTSATRRHQLSWQARAQGRAAAPYQKACAAGGHGCLF
jgi:hypothetical protein